MSHTNTTTNYGLPLFVSTDKPAWLVDFNGAMNTIDTTLHDADVTAQGASDKADTVTANLATANQNIATLQQTAVSQGAQVNANSTSISNLNSSVGNTSTLDTTAKTCVGGINEVNERVVANGVASAVSLVANTDFIVPSDGYIRIGLSSLIANGYTSLKINNLNICKIGNGTTGTFSVEHYLPVFVKKGMTAYFETNGGLATFYGIE